MHIVLCTLSSVGDVAIQIYADKLQYTFATNHNHIISIYISVFLSTNSFVSSNGRIQRDLMKYKHSQLHSTRGQFLNNKIVWKSTAWRTIGLAETLMKWQSLILSYWEHKAFCFRIVQRKMLCNNAQHTTGYCSVTCLIFIAADVNYFDDNQCTRTRCWETLKKSTSHYNGQPTSNNASETSQTSEQLVINWFISTACKCVMGQLRSHTNIRIVEEFSTPL